MAEIKVHLPDDIAEYGPELQLVFTLMVRKLFINREKGWGGIGADALIDLHTGIVQETDELLQALVRESQMAAVDEAVDVANMGTLTAVALLRLKRSDFRSASWRGKPE